MLLHRITHDRRSNDISQLVVQIRKAQMCQVPTKSFISPSTYCLLVKKVLPNPKTHIRTLPTACNSMSTKVVPRDLASCLLPTRTLVLDYIEQHVSDFKFQSKPSVYAKAWNPTTGI